jgi:hypothetical protein
MENKRCSGDQRINGQRTYQRTTEVVPSSAYENPDYRSLQDRGRQCYFRRQRRVKVIAIVIFSERSLSEAI